MVKPPEGEGVKVRSEVSPALKDYKKRKSGTSTKAKSRAKKQRKRGVQAHEVGPPRFPDWDLEDPLLWEENFGNFNLARFDSADLMSPPLKVAPVKRLKDDLCVHFTS